jgi:cytochrome c556
MRFFVILGLLAAFVGGAAQAQPAYSPDAMIATRQAGMDLQGIALGAIKAAVDAKADVKPLKNASDAIGNWARAIPGMFPTGTEGGKTKALAAVWSDNAGFTKASADLATAAAALSTAAAAGDAATFADAFKAAGGACGGCHRTYRAR